MSRSIPWTRVLVEGVVVVGSILLAFAIDAMYGFIVALTLLTIRALVAWAVEGSGSREDE